MAAGIETLRILSTPQVYSQLEARSSLLEQGITQTANKIGIGIQISRVGSMFTIFFSKVPVTDYETATKADTELYARFFHQMLSQGIYLPPSQFEAAFVSTAHTDADIHATVRAINEAFSSLA